MKVYVAYKTTNEPWGGGNQFIRFLTDNLNKLNLLSDLKSSDLVLFNSHQHPDEILNIKKTYPQKKFVHRIDGPMRLYNSMNDNRDLLVYQLNDIIADGTIFQSKYSLEANISLGLSNKKPHCIIHNESDSSIFFPKKIIPKKNKIISTSWSSNQKKGFSTYEYLDNHLDFKNLEYVFAGNPPIDFKNIKNLGALTSVEISQELRSSSLYITASENDPCSNSLIEAISTHTPVLALDSGGHPELVLESGETYKSQESLIDLISHMLKNLSDYKFPQTKNSVNQYISFFNKILNEE